MNGIFKEHFYERRICEKAIFRRQRFVLYAVGMAQGLQSRSVGFGQRLHRSAQQGAAAYDV